MTKAIRNDMVDFLLIFQTALGGINRSGDFTNPAKEK